MLQADIHVNVHARKKGSEIKFRVMGHANSGYVTDELSESDLRVYLQERLDVERDKEINATIERAKIMGNSGAPMEASHDLNSDW